MSLAHFDLEIYFFLMFLLTLSFALSMESFLSYFRGEEYSGESLNNRPCHIYILDLSTRQKKETEFQLTLETAEFPGFKFVYYYNASDAKQVTTLIGKNAYHLELLDSNYTLSNVNFRYGKDFVEIERVGYSSIGPKVRCTKK